MSYVRNCYVDPRSPDEILFEGKENGHIIATLDGYAVVPMEKYKHPTPVSKLMDKVQLRSFLDYLLLKKVVGATSEETFEEDTPVRAFLIGQLGKLTPNNGWELARGVDHYTLTDGAKAMSDFLRKVADSIDHYNTKTKS